MLKIWFMCGVILTLAALGDNVSILSMQYWASMIVFSLVFSLHGIIGSIVRTLFSGNTLEQRENILILSIAAMMLWGLVALYAGKYVLENYLIWLA